MSAIGFSALRAFVSKHKAVERCDLCRAVLRERHEHLLDPEARRLLCACDPCAILFATDGETKYRRVPRDSFRLSNFALTDQSWHSLGIPIGLAFIFVSSALNRTIAIYPSPAGPTVTVVDDEAWQEIVTGNHALSQLRPDIEALLVNRMNGAREYFLAPIDECYRLTGIVRQHWRGFSGGEDGWKEIARFFDELKERSCPEAPAYARSIV